MNFRYPEPKVPNLVFFPGKGLVLVVFFHYPLFQGWSLEVFPIFGKGCFPSPSVLPGCSHRIKFGMWRHGVITLHLCLFQVGSQGHSRALDTKRSKPTWWHCGWEFHLKWCHFIPYLIGYQKYAGQKWRILLRMIKRNCLWEIKRTWKADRWPS